MPGFVFWGTKAQHINIYRCKCESKTYKSVNYSLVIMSLLTIPVCWHPGYLLGLMDIAQWSWQSCRLRIEHR